MSANLRSLLDLSAASALPVQRTPAMQSAMLQLYQRTASLLALIPDPAGALAGAPGSEHWYHVARQHIQAAATLGLAPHPRLADLSHDAAAAASQPDVADTAPTTKLLANLSRKHDSLRGVAPRCATDCRSARRGVTCRARASCPY